MTRGQLWALVCAVGMCGLSGCGQDEPTQPLGDTTIQVDTSLAQFSVLGTVGGWVALESGDLFGLPPHGVFILRTAPDGVLVLDRSCTFEQCQVEPFAGGRATCPCSGTQYNFDGVPVQGPALFPLTVYPSSIDGNLVEFTV